jgi:ABC-type dipeptide/oligopeptide/nickel transport system permease subunit
MAKGMVYGSPSVVSYAVGIFVLYPLIGILAGTIVAFLIGLIVTLILFMISRKIR